jgi:hypothetical protein
METTMSFLKNNKSWDKPFSEKVAKRVAKIPTGELELWIDQAILEIGRCISGYQRGRDKFYIEEARQGAEALHAVVEELYKRMN